MTPRPRLAGQLRLHDGRRRRGRHRGREGHFLGRLMRHFSLPLAGNVPALPCRVRALPGRRCLVRLTGLPQRLLPRQLAAGSAAVAVAPVTVGAQEEHLPALPPAACHEPKRIPHRTRCTPSSGATPRPGIRLASPQARHAHGHAAPDGPLSGCWGALRLLGRAFQPSAFVPHSPPTSFRSPPRTPPRTPQPGLCARPERSASTSDDHGYDGDQRRHQLDVDPLSRGSQ